MRKRGKGNPRLLWNGRYKPYYVFLDLDDIDPDRRIDEEEVTRRWWAFLDDVEYRLVGEQVS